MQKFEYSETCVNGNMWDREDSLTPLRSSYMVPLAQSSEKGSVYVGSALEPQTLCHAPFSCYRERAVEKVRGKPGPMGRWTIKGFCLCVPNGLPSEDEASMDYYSMVASSRKLSATSGLQDCPEWKRDECPTE